MHLVRRDRQEDLCFGLWHPSSGFERQSCLLRAALLPLAGERRVHGNVSFQPQYLERAIGESLTRQAGIVFMHSHLGPGWQGMSEDDVVAEKKMAPLVSAATGLPLLGMTIGTDGAWSARVWIKNGPGNYALNWCESVRIVGEKLRITFHDGLCPVPGFRAELARTLSAWGAEVQGTLGRLKVGVVGAGSVGSINAEGLARMGVGTIKLFDFDSIKTINLDRVLHATSRDARLGRSKVKVLARALRTSGTAHNFHVDPYEYSVVEPEGFARALDCDVLFSCVDRPWPRQVLNFIAFAHLIPVVDGGILVTAKERRGDIVLQGADWRAHIAAPTRCCLECLEQYNPGDVSTERDGYLDDPSYIAGLPKSHPARRNENVFGFSLGAASLELLQFLSMIVAPLGMHNSGAQMYHFVTGMLDQKQRRCAPDCPYLELTALGNHANLKVASRHKVAELARQERARRQRKWSWRFKAWLTEQLDRISLRLN